MPDTHIGLMSGTSVDAVDAALVDFSGATPVTLGFESLPIPQSLRDELLALQSSAPDELARAARAAIELTRLYAQVARALAPVPGAVRAIGAHGQTVRHRPESGYTIQLIDGALLAELTGIPVVCDFRASDIAAGGQGAPLVPAFHAGVFGAPGKRRAVVNIGGFANLSLLAPGEPVRGFDSGPGNVLLDAWCERHTGQRFDRDGRWGAGGRVDPALLEILLAEPYFARASPKSTGRDLFDLDWLRGALETRREAGAATRTGGGAGPSDLEARDVQATLVELAARTIADAIAAFGADEVYVCGGGANNRALIDRLRALVAPAPLAGTDALGVAPQAVEAIAFAWLAARRMTGLAGNVPEVTGARGPRVLGALYEAPGRLSGRE